MYSGASIDCMDWLNEKHSGLFLDVCEHVSEVVSQGRPLCHQSLHLQRKLELLHSVPLANLEDDL